MCAMSEAESVLQAACQMLMHGDQKLESILLNLDNPGWLQQVEQKTVNVLAMICLDSTGRPAYLS